MFSAVGYIIPKVFMWWERAFLTPAYKNRQSPVFVGRFLWFIITGHLIPAYKNLLFTILVGRFSKNGLQKPENLPTRSGFS